MKALTRRGASVIIPALLAGCAFIPRAYPRLEEARAAHAAASADSQVACFAASQLREATGTLERAENARNTLDDPAVVDHLAYVAMQRVAIAREVAKLAATHRTCS